MLKVIVFNAPPRAGKEVAAKAVMKVINTEDSNLVAYHKEFKDELFKVAANTLGISVEEFIQGYDKRAPEVLGWYPSVEWYKDYKSITVRDNKFSQREWLIHISENVIKPSFGKDVFGKMFVNSLPQEGIIAVSDGGFPEEIQPVIDHVGAENITIVRIHREGCDFSNDSRDYLTQDMFDSTIRIIDVENNGTIDKFETDVVHIIGGILNEQKP